MHVCIHGIDWNIFPIFTVSLLAVAGSLCWNKSSFKCPLGNITKLELYNPFVY